MRPRSFLDAARAGWNVDRVFPQNVVHVSVPLKNVVTISQPYLYKNGWLIDLKLGKKAMMVNTLNVGMVDRTPTDEVSLLFLNRVDAAQARAYLMKRLPK